MSDKYFHEKENLINADAVTVPVYNDAGQFIGNRKLDISLYFDPFESTGLVNNVGSLVIPTGADEITWGYQVNTKRTPTYGGEVVQILSMYADKMIIKGTCRNYGEQRGIYDYFKNYMRYVTGMTGGSTDRRQNFLQFRYPARNWSFVIMVIDAQNLTMKTAQAAPEWMITAEIVSENNRIEFGKQRVDKWANVLPTVIPKVTAPVAAQGRKGTRAKMLGGSAGTDTGTGASSGVSALNLPPEAVGKPGAAVNFKNIARTAENDPFGDLMEFANGTRGKVAENFASMMASYATGDLTTLRNNPLNEPEKSADEIWKAKFGTDVAFTIGGGSGGGSGTVGGTGTDGASSSLSGTLTAVQVAALAAAGFNALGMADKAKDKATLVEAVKVAFGESGWNTRSINYNGSGGQEDYDSYIAGDAKKAPTSSSGGNAASYDLGLWQINNYWHPNEIRVACGETGISHSSPQAGSSGWSDSVQKNIELNNLQKMLDDPLANAKAMAVIFGNNKNWDSWVAHGKSGYDSADSDAKAGVTQYLSDPGKYDAEVANGINVGGGTNLDGTPSVGGDVAYPLPNPKSGEWSGGVADHMSRQLGNWESDNACDLFRDPGTPVYAVADGEITTDGFGYTEPHDTIYGARLHLKTKYGYFFYQHMKRGYAGSEIKQGAKIKRGQLLGYVEDGGLIGCASHIHFGMKGGPYGEGESGNPETFLEQVYKQVKG